MMGFIIVNMTALLLMGFIVWWFFGSKPKAIFAEKNKPILILVKDGVYQPAHIQIEKHKPIVLHFLRKDATPCAETVSFPQLNMAYHLGVNQTVEIVVPAQSTGEIDFTCQMGMYRGKLIVK